MVQALATAAGEGAFWGLAAGAGAVWVLLSTEQMWGRFFIVTAVCGSVLALADFFLQGLAVTAPLYVLFVSGLLFPLFLIGSARIGRPG
jgi:hypothetical protein